MPSPARVEFLKVANRPEMEIRFNEEPSPPVEPAPSAMSLLPVGVTPIHRSVPGDTERLRDLGTVRGPMGDPSNFLGMAARNELFSAYPELNTGRRDITGQVGFRPSAIAPGQPYALPESRWGWEGPSASPETSYNTDTGEQEIVPGGSHAIRFGENFLYQPGREVAVPFTLEHERAHLTPQGMDTAYRARAEGPHEREFMAPGGPFRLGWSPEGKGGEAFADYSGAINAVARGFTTPETLVAYMREHGFPGVRPPDAYTGQNPRSGYALSVDPYVGDYEHPAPLARSALIEKAMQLVDTAGPAGAAARVMFDPSYPHRVLADEAIPVARDNPEAWGGDSGAMTYMGTEPILDYVVNRTDDALSRGAGGVWDAIRGIFGRRRSAQPDAQVPEGEEKTSSFRLWPEHVRMFAIGVERCDLESLGRFL